MTLELIATAMSKVMADIKPVAKNGYNPSQKFSFRSIDDTVAHVNVAMVKHGVVLLPEVEHVARYDRQTAKGNTMQFVQITMGYTFMASDGSCVRVSTVGEAGDSGDKATSKAMSMALKYALFQTFLIPTGDADPDSEVVEATVNPDALTDEDRDLIREMGELAGLTGPALAEVIGEAVNRTVATFGDVRKSDMKQIKIFLAGRLEATAKGEGK